MYDWDAPLPPCDWCGEDVDEEVPWLDREDFWGHAECATWQTPRRDHTVAVEQVS